MLRKFFGFSFLGLAVLLAAGAAYVFHLSQKPKNQRPAWMNKKLGSVFVGSRGYEKDLAAEQQRRSFCKDTGNGRYCGYKDGRGRIVYDPVLDEAGPFSDQDVARVVLDGKHGFLGRDGKYIVRPHLDWAGKAMDEKGVKAIDRGRIVIVHPDGRIEQTAQLGKRSNWLWRNLLAVQKAGKWGIFHINGLEMVKPQYDEIGKVPPVPKNANNQKFRYYLPYRAAVRIRLGDKWGYIIFDDGRDRMQILEPDFEEAQQYTGAPVVVRQNGKYGVINRSGRWLLLPRYQNMPVVKVPDLVELGQRYDEYNGLISIRLNGRWGVVDSGGRFIINSQYDELRCWQYGYGTMPVVRLGKYWGLLNSHGQEVLPPRFDKIECFEKNACQTMVTENGKNYRIDRSGNRLPDDAPDITGRKGSCFKEPKNRYVKLPGDAQGR